MSVPLLYPSLFRCSLVCPLTSFSSLQRCLTHKVIFSSVSSLFRGSRCLIVLFLLRIELKIFLQLQHQSKEQSCVNLFFVGFLKSNYCFLFLCFGAEVQFALFFCFHQNQTNKTNKPFLLFFFEQTLSAALVHLLRS